MRILVTVRGAILVATLGLMVSATGCSTPTQGQPTTPDGVPTTTSTSKLRPTTTTAASSSKPVGTDPLAGKSPCSLLGDAERAQLGLTTAPKEKNLSDRRQCLFSEKDFATGVNVYDRNGLDGMEQGRDKVTSIPNIGRHKAIQAMFGTTCMVAMEITPTSAVEGTGTADTDAQSCEIAMKMALAIEPKLP